MIKVEKVESPSVAANEVLYARNLTRAQLNAANEAIAANAPPKPEPETYTLSGLSLEQMRLIKAATYFIYVKNGPRVPEVPESLIELRNALQYPAAVDIQFTDQFTTSADSNTTVLKRL